MSVRKSLSHNKAGSGETILENKAMLTLPITVVFCGLLGFLGTSQGHKSAIQNPDS